MFKNLTFDEKNSTYCNKVLKGLLEKDILIWYGTSRTYNTQYYRLNF